MTLPVSGPISFADISTEITGLSTPSQISLGDSTTRSLLSETSGSVDLKASYGKAYTIPGNSGVLTSGSSYTLPRTSGLTVNVIAIGGGGGGGDAYATSIPVTPGQSVSFSIGGGGGGGAVRDGIYSGGSYGSSGGSTSVTINGTTYVIANAGGGAQNSPGGGHAGAGGVSAGSQLTGPTDGQDAPADTTAGGPGARGFTINTTVGTVIGSILGYGNYGTGYTQGSGGYSTTGTGYGAGGTGGGCSQSDVYNYNNMFSASGASGAVFIWWGY